MNAIVESEMGQRNAELLGSLLGWAGEKPKTLAEVGQRFGITRERVRQLKVKFEEKVQRIQLRPPSLERSIQLTANSAPAVSEDIIAILVSSGLIEKRDFSIESLIKSCAIFGVDAPVILQKLNRGKSLVVPRGNLIPIAPIKIFAMRAARRFGCGSIVGIASDIFSSFSSGHGENGEKIIRTVLDASGDFTWLDESQSWFCYPRSPRNRLNNRVRKILSVSPSIDVGELRSGIRKDPRMDGFVPSRKILLQYCEVANFCSVSDGRVIATEDLIPSETLGGLELDFFEVLSAHGGLMERQQLGNACFDRGMNINSWSTKLSGSPILTQPVPGVFALIGTEIPPGAAEALQPRTVYKKVMQDWGWTTDTAQPWIAIRANRGHLFNGLINIHKSQTGFIQGAFAVSNSGSAVGGAIRFNQTMASGFRPYFIDMGLEEGDTLLLLFDLLNRSLSIEIGGDEIADKYRGK